MSLLKRLNNWIVSHFVTFLVELVMLILQSLFLVIIFTNPFLKGDFKIVQTLPKCAPEPRL